MLSYEVSAPKFLDSSLLSLQVCYMYIFFVCQHLSAMSCLERFSCMCMCYYAVALTLTGGVQHVDASGTKVRGESHLLLIGDPGHCQLLSKLYLYICMPLKF